MFVRGRRFTIWRNCDDFLASFMYFFNLTFTDNPGVGESCVLYRLLLTAICVPLTYVRHILDNAEPGKSEQNISEIVHLHCSSDAVVMDRCRVLPPICPLPGVMQPSLRPRPDNNPIVSQSNTPLKIHTCKLIIETTPTPCVTYFSLPIQKPAILGSYPCVIGINATSPSLSGRRSWTTFCFNIFT